MTRHTQPLPPDKIRVTLYVGGMEDALTSEHPTSHLQEILDGLERLPVPPMLPLIKGTHAGAMVARDLFDISLHGGNPLLATMLALWVCVYGDNVPPGTGLTIDQLTKTAGSGMLSIYVNSSRTYWNYLLQTQTGQISGRVTVPRSSQWAGLTVGSA